MRCKYLSELKTLKEEIRNELSTKAMEYLFEEQDEVQIPLSRMGNGDVLYGNTTCGLVVVQWLLPLHLHTTHIIFSI